jgi:hypothetical protein
MDLMLAMKKLIYFIQPKSQFRWHKSIVRYPNEANKTTSNNYNYEL